MFRATIINPNKSLYEGLVHSITLPGEYGEFEVMTFHCPIMSTLKQGNIILRRTESSPEKFIPIKHGIAKIGLESELLVLVDG